MVSPGRELDRQIRIALLECMQVMLRIGNTEAAREMGETSRKFAERIAIHNYDEEDRKLESWGSIIRDSATAMSPYPHS